MRASGSWAVLEVAPSALAPGESRNAVGHEDGDANREEGRANEKIHQSGSHDRSSNGRQARASASPKNNARITPLYSTAYQPLCGSPSHSPGFSTVSADLISTVQSRPDKNPDATDTTRSVARAVPATRPPLHGTLGRPFFARRNDRSILVCGTPRRVGWRKPVTHFHSPRLGRATARVDAAKLCGRLPLIHSHRFSPQNVSAGLSDAYMERA